MGVMARPGALDGSFNVLGRFIPIVVGLVAGMTLVASVMGGLTAQAGAGGLLAAGALVPHLVFAGQVWRLFTWVLFQMDALSLVFGILGLVWFGSDLVRIWGARRFLGYYFGLAGVTGLVTCLIALVWPAVGRVMYLTAWPMLDALIVAWAVYFPTRDVLVYFVLPLRGQKLIYATLIGTAVYAALHSIEAFVPHFVAQLLMLAFLRGMPFNQIWARVKYEFAYRRWKRKASRLRAVPPSSADEPTRWYH
jgi:membrane associated rhomboid family serine protease